MRLDRCSMRTSIHSWCHMNVFDITWFYLAKWCPLPTIKPAASVNDFLLFNLCKLNQLWSICAYKLVQIGSKISSTVEKCWSQFPRKSLKSLGLWPGCKLTRDNDSAQAALRVASIETLRTTFRTEPFWMPQMGQISNCDHLRLGRDSEEPGVFSCDIPSTLWRWPVYYSLTAAEKWTWFWP